LLKKKFGAPEAIMEWTYNIHDAAHRYRTESADCLIFYDILTDGMFEDIYSWMQAKLDRLKVLLHRLESLEFKDGKAIAGEQLPKRVLFEALRSLWSADKEIERQMNDVKAALEFDQPGDFISYSSLIENEADSLFFEFVKQREIELRNEYLQSLDVSEQNMAIMSRGDTDHLFHFRKH
jgi:hypothetical protein